LCFTVDDDDVLNLLSECGNCFGHFVEERLLCDYQRRVGPAQLVLDLLSWCAVEDGERYGAKVYGGIIHDVTVNGVGQDDRDGIATADA
jgi:hypothetical protein